MRVSVTGVNSSSGVDKLLQLGIKTALTNGLQEKIPVHEKITMDFDSKASDTSKTKTLKSKSGAVVGRKAA